MIGLKQKRNPLRSQSSTQDKKNQALCWLFSQCYRCQQHMCKDPHDPCQRCLLYVYGDHLFSHSEMNFLIILWLKRLTKIHNWMGTQHLVAIIHFIIICSLCQYNRFLNGLVLVNLDIPILNSDADKQKYLNLNCNNSILLFFHWNNF